MKRLLLFIMTSVLISASVILFGNPAASAAPLDFTGGINDEYEYEEIVFLSGEPVKFVGTFEISERNRGEGKLLTYRFKLSPEDKNIDGLLDRRVTYEIIYTKRDDKGQTISRTELNSCREKIYIGDDLYSLSDYQFSKSDVIDNRPASDFYSGTLKARKYYDINKDEGKAVVEISGNTIGYENFWGSTETQLLDYFIDVDRQVPADEDEENPRTVSWQGIVKAEVSDSMNKSLQYSQNAADLSSFTGGYMRITAREMFSRYEYNLPQIEEGVAEDSKRIRGEVEINRRLLPQVERLVVPKFRDIGGHWAEEDINKLYSLDVFAGNSLFFVPDVPITRMEFTKAVINASDIRVSADENGKSTQNGSADVRISPFVDVSIQDPDYLYVREALNKGIISGVAQGRFMPDEPLTRAQAITMLIRALGMENRAPTPGYCTSFTDDCQIPSWARDSIYVAREIGLIQGDAGNRVNPNKEVTRAEASSMLVRFLNFLQRDLQRNYREDIIFFS